jgi:hypothetical protein
LLIEYEKTHQWDKLYGLLYSGFRYNKTMEQYSKRRQYWLNKFPEKQIMDFVPQSLRGPDNPTTSEWFIFGCITKIEQGYAKGYEGLVNAYYEKNDWYFSEPQVIVGVDGPATECDLSK